MQQGIIGGNAVKGRSPAATFACRSGCGACCIAPSISSAIPGMPDGKPAGVRCLHLADDARCRIFMDPLRPKVCASLKANLEMCGETTHEAYRFLAHLEAATTPCGPHNPLRRVVAT
jgi:hypothetical protein